VPFAHEVAALAVIRAQRRDLHDPIDPCRGTGLEQGPRCNRVQLLESLAIVLAQDADSVDDSIDADQFRQPVRRMKIAGEIDVDRTGCRSALTPRLDHGVAGGPQLGRQSPTDETAGADEQNVHVVKGTAGDGRRLQ
jgi:hypothetical protein